MEVFHMKKADPLEMRYTLKMYTQDYLEIKELNGITMMNMK